jgi:hypothetical protein
VISAPAQGNACIVPGCANPATFEFKAFEHGRLGALDWQPGDLIRLCPRHASDVYAAQHVQTRDQLAEWLRPDAKPFYDELLDRAEGGDPDAGPLLRQWVDKQLGRHR